jgi:hypothetical protein
MADQRSDEQRGRRAGVRQIYPIFRRTETGEHVKIVKRWLSPLDPTFRSFYSVDAESRFWQEARGGLNPAVAPPQLVERHKQWNLRREAGLTGQPGSPRSLSTPVQY